MELRKKISFKEYMVLRDRMECFRDLKAGEDYLYPYTCTTYKKDGITITIRDSNEKEKIRCHADRHHFLILKVNPSRLLNSGTYINCIMNYGQFKQAIECLCMNLELIFGDMWDDAGQLKTYSLQRIDFTKDIKKVPEAVIQQFILLLRRLPLKRGYYLNKKLEANCSEFHKENSFNVVNESQGIEFVIYNKHQAAIDQKYPDDIVEGYKDTLRMELRCERKFIKGLTEENDTKKIIKNLYKSMDEKVQGIYFSMLKYHQADCFLSRYFAIKIIDRTVTGEAKKTKMVEFVKQCNRYSDYNVCDVGFQLFDTEKRYKKMEYNFMSLGIAPITIEDNTIPFIQSPDSMLEFEELSEQEKMIFGYVKRKTRGKDVFIHAW
jgi:hypothetical protein